MILNLFATISSLGFGVHAQNMLKALVDIGVDVNLNTIGQRESSTYYDKYVNEAIDNYKGYNKNNPSLQIFHEEYLQQVGGSEIVSFSIFETTKVRDQVLWNLKNVADKVFVTTQQHAWLLQDQGVTPGKVHIVHEGVDPELYNTKSCTKHIDTGKFTYIIVGKHEERKNTDMVIRSFINTLQYKECALIAHTYNVFTKVHTELKLDQYGFKQKKANDKGTMFSNGICDIYLTNPIPDITEMRSLYRSANVGIDVSRGGAWELPLIELLACGVPCIASNVIGHSEYLVGAPKALEDLIIEPSGTEVANDGVWFRGDRGEWATINSEDLSDMLEETYDDQDDYLILNEGISKYYIDNFNWNLAAQRVKELLL